MDVSRRFPFSFSRGTAVPAAAAPSAATTAPAARTPTAGVGRAPDPLLWLDRDMTFQLLETIGADSGRRSVTKAVHAWQTIDREAPGDIALGEHLAAGLDQRERYVVIFRTLNGEGRLRAAAQLGLDRAALVDIEHSACLKAATLTCRYHDNLICEPAELVLSVGQTQREEAVAGHLSSCTRCGPEFAARVANVLHHSARFMTAYEGLVDQR